MTETVCGDLIAFYCCLVDYKLQWCSYNLTAFCVPCITVNWHYIYFLIISAFRSCHSKKRKVDFEYHVYKAQWRLNYLVNKLDGKALYLSCNDTIAVPKECNIHWHSQTITIFPTHRKEIRKIRKLNVEYLIMLKFLSKNKK